MYFPYGPVYYSKGPLPHPEAGLFCLLFSVSPPCYSWYRLCYAGAAAPPPYIALRHHPASPISVPRRAAVPVLPSLFRSPGQRPASPFLFPHRAAMYFRGRSLPVRRFGSPPPLLSPGRHFVSLPAPLPFRRPAPPSPLLPPGRHFVSLPRSSAVPPSNTSVCAPIGPPRRVSPRFLPLLILSVLLTSHITFYGFTFLVKYPTIQSQQQDT